jgi:hypothetical protein
MVDDKVCLVVMVACQDALFGNPKYLGGLDGSKPPPPWYNGLLTKKLFIF